MFEIKTRIQKLMQKLQTNYSDHRKIHHNWTSSHGLPTSNMRVTDYFFKTSHKLMIHIDVTIGGEEL